MDTQEVAETAPPNLRKKVLVIDDSKTIVEVVRHTLEQAGGFDVVVAYDGVQGLQQYYREHPDLVIVDVMMPNLDGFQFVRCVRGDAESSQTPLIILSALASEDSRLTGILSGADEYLTKPFRKEDLHATIARVLSLTAEDRTQQVMALADAVDGGATGMTGAALGDTVSGAHGARDGVEAPGAEGAMGTAVVGGDSA